MKMIILISLLLIACNQTPHVNNESIVLDTLSENSSYEPKIAVSPKDSISFNEFENLVKNEEYIPLDVFKKFVAIDLNSLTYSSETKFIGKGIQHENNYTFFYIKQGDKKNGNSVLITYDKENKQIDLKIFMSYCEPCSEEALLSDISFLSAGKQNDFIVKYFKPTNSKAMPDMDNIKIVRSEKWMINDAGFFIIKSK